MSNKPLDTSDPAISAAWKVRRHTGRHRGSAQWGPIRPTREDLLPETHDTTRHDRIVTTILIPPLAPMFVFPSSFRTCLSRSLPTTGCSPHAPRVRTDRRQMQADDTRPIRRNNNTNERKQHQSTNEREATIQREQAYGGSSRFGPYRWAIFMIYLGDSVAIW